MALNSADKLYSYIQTKTEKLQASRKGVTIRTMVIWAVAFGLWLFDQISGGNAIVLIVLASAWSSVQDAITNLHIDTLGALHRDLDRDEAENLHGFETPR